MISPLPHPPRTPWPPGFPDAAVHTTLELRDGHPDYLAAKSGDFDAADRLIADLMDDTAVQETSRLISSRPPPLIAPVRAVETLGVNQIPNAFAQALADQLGLQVADDIVQTNVVGHTRAKAAHRMVFQPVFDGQVEPGRQYIVVDDHVGLGGTIANMKGHIESHGATVIGVVTLTTGRDCEKIALRTNTLDTLRERHGAIENWWRERFGHGFDCLTEPEAGHLVRIPNADTIRNRLAKAEREGLPQPQEGGVGESPEGQRVKGSPASPAGEAR